MDIKCKETSDFKESSNLNFLNVEHQYKPAVVAKWLSRWREFQYFNVHNETESRLG